VFVKKRYRIHIRAGQGNLNELIDELARQVVRKHTDAFQINHDRVKKIPA
jgi:hypothetical protein